MFAGSIPYGLTLFLLLTPLPSLSTNGVAIWFGVMYILFFLFNTFTNIPYDALGQSIEDMGGRGTIYSHAHIEKWSRGP